MDYNISLYLDKRTSSKKINNLFPVKLRLYSSITKTKKLYPTGIDLSIDDFNTIFNSETKVRGKNKETKIILQQLEGNAERIAKDLTPFSFNAFEKKMFRSKDAHINVAYHYKEKIKRLKSNDQVSTASNYNLSLKSLSNFLESKTNNKLKNLTFYDITADFLNKYESYMVHELNKSRTTVSMYTRALRTIFNDAISENDIKREVYPFGKGNDKYQIPNAKGVKKALTKEEISLLFNATPSTPEQEKAKDFWFFSYMCFGMNIKDILLLKHENLNDDNLTYYRAKTVNTKKSNLKKVKVFLNDFSNEVINKYGTSPMRKNKFVFPIISEKDDVVEQQKKIKNFTSFINLHFNKLAKQEGFKFKISTYWARHSFATLSIQKGASMEFISEALNHSNLSVTKNYFAGFEDEAKKHFVNKLMEF
ncbi:tyrosine-type recombinase/integrase [Namhaeicola litoreus]|uniref:Tyrosine-type recombinase/integrase n=1 Tax=Namhaeicola litoreus TaxID=1052145 RepID=A0ABW3Y2U6_9FLAO